MARYTASRTKLSRRIGKNLFLKGARSFSAKDDFTKRPHKISKNGKKAFVNLSEYGKQLVEKQYLKYSYGLLERQFSNVFAEALKKEGDTGFIALTKLETRLDNVIYKAGLSNSRSQARQLVNHGHFTVNGKKVNIPSFAVKQGDVITVKPNKLKKPFWTNFQLEVPNSVPSWMQVSDKTVKVVNLPLLEDLPEGFNLAAIVEHYS